MDGRIIRGIVSIGLGVVITSISGLFQNPFVRILDVAHMGVPLTWMTRVIPSSLMFIDWVNFVADWIFWMVIAFSIIAIATYLWHRRAKRIWMSIRRSRI